MLNEIRKYANKQTAIDKFCLYLYTAICLYTKVYIFRQEVID